MYQNYHKHQRVGSCQDLHNFLFWNNLPEPTLWNSRLGRRQFLGKVGKASVAVAIASNTLKLAIAQSPSACGTKTVNYLSKAVATAFVSVADVNDDMDTARSNALAKVMAEMTRTGLFKAEYLEPGTVPKCAVRSFHNINVGGNGSTMTITGTGPYTVTITLPAGAYYFVRYNWTTSSAHPSACSPVQP